MADEQRLTIGELARATNTKVETIRYYERIGLLPAPARTGGNYRSYAPDHLGRLSSSGARATWASRSTRSGRCSTLPTSASATALTSIRSRASI